MYGSIAHILNAEGLKDHFPNVYEHCLARGIDITKDMIPVVPAAHYSCGGIKVDMDGQSNIDRLYALGEASSTGLAWCKQAGIKFTD